MSATIPQLTLSILDFLKMNQAPFSATIKTRTEFALLKKSTDGKKTPNNFGTIYKVQQVYAGINHDYQKSVNQQRAVEGVDQNFIADELKWGKVVKGTKSVVEKAGGMYLKTIELGKVGSAHYENEAGERVAFEDIKKFISTAKGSSKKQELEDEVKVRTYKFSSILDIVVKANDLVVRFKPV